jgi:16S rRNA (cytosine967-C5)-methyltransferase
MSAISGRAIAARVLLRVHEDAAFASAALAAEIERHPQLDERERGLATELVYGTLRTEGVLRKRLDRFVTKGLKKTDEHVVVQLLLAAYQILVLTRVPAHAAVDAAVTAVKKERGPKMAGFTNAVLRKVAATGEQLDTATAVLESAPEWLLRELVASVGEAEAHALLGATNAGPPSLCIRVREGRALPEAFADSEPGQVSPLARRLKRMGDPRKNPAYADGAFVVQEEGAQLIALALGARSGDKVLDACAGRGQKASLLAERVGPRGVLHAVDLHEKKLNALASEFQRLGLPAPRLSAVDWTLGVADVQDDFDRVLVDAPCTGVGTLARRPEIVRRLEPTDPERASGTAEAILRNAATRVKPGGRVVFAVCSVLQAEAEVLVTRVGDVLAPVPFDAPEASAVAGERSAFRLLPLAHGTDGYFVASFVRR